MERKQERDLFDQVFSTKNFARTLSYREFVTSLSLALLLLALHSIIDYYASEDWVENYEPTVKWTLFCILLPINHVFYRVEHGRSNNFIGRNIHDYIFILLFASLLKATFYFRGFGYSFGVQGIGSLIVLLFIVFFSVVIFELAVALVKRALKFLQWQIL